MTAWRADAHRFPSPDGAAPDVIKQRVGDARLFSCCTEALLDTPDGFAVFRTNTEPSMLATPRFNSMRTRINSGEIGLTLG
jgi:hypothetical protein